VAIDTFYALGNFVCPGHIPDRNLVDIELLMPELHRYVQQALEYAAWLAEEEVIAS
jgi:hypothetical protein